MKTSWLKAIKNGHFYTWPGLDVTLVAKHLTPSILTAKGHMHQEKGGLQSTKHVNSSSILKNIKSNIATLKKTTNQHNEEMFDILKDSFPSTPSPNKKSNNIIYSIIEHTQKGIGYIDLPGQFPFISASGTRYLLIAYNYDGNTITAATLRNRNASTISTAWKKLNDEFEKVGISPNTYIIENEASDDLKTAMHSQDIKHQLVPPHKH